MSNPRKPIARPPARLRQRWRARSESWRIWWEPSKDMQAVGMQTTELSGLTRTKAVHKAEQLNAEADKRLGRARPTSAPQLSARKGTVAALAADYIKSPAFEKLAEATQVDYTNYHKILAEKWGRHKVADLTKPMIFNWYEALYATGKKTYAKAIITRLSGLISYGEKKGYCVGNPAMRLGLYQPAPRSRVASWPEIDALFASAAPWPSMACGMALALYHGQRKKDIVEAKRADVTGNMWRLVRSKRGNLGSFDLHPEVLPYLDAAMQGHEEQDTLLISEITGRPYTLDHFAKVFTRVRAIAAMDMPELANFQFRDFRRTAAHLARMGGAALRDVGDMLGNNVYEDPQLSGTYMPANHESASKAVHAIQRPEAGKKRKTK